jgi:hypothetical protein
MLYCKSLGSAHICRALTPLECIFYRNLLRNARYAALANAEGFSEICFAIEALGLRLLGKQATLSKYEPRINKLSENSTVLVEISKKFPSKFKSFEALFSIVITARNDAMHIGAYARHATVAGIELCIGLEESLMTNVERTVSNLMVVSPVTVESWQPVAQARQLMLMNSFSYLPVRIESMWWLISELCLAKYLEVKSQMKKERLGLTIKEAMGSSLELLEVKNEDLLTVNMTIAEVLQRASVQNGPTLWLVVDEKHPEHLAGVLTPFELM